MNKIAELRRELNSVLEKLEQPRTAENKELWRRTVERKIDLEHRIIKARVARSPRQLPKGLAPMSVDMTHGR